MVSQSTMCCEASPTPEAELPGKAALSTVDPGELVAEGISANGRFEEHFALLPQILGAGAFATVRVAIRRHSCARVAVKSLTKEGLSASDWENLRREVHVHASLDHPNIVRLERVFESSNVVHLVMEVLSGGDLFNRVLQTTGLAEPESARVSAQLLRALAYLHTRCIAHLDVKLENVVYEAHGSKRVKLIDFGFATAFKPGELLQRKCGSAQYAAPEIFSNDSYDEKVDLWSLGSVVYCMLLATPLYSGSHSELAWKHQVGRVDYAPGFTRLSSRAQDFVRSLLTVEPEDRASAEEALEHRWLWAQAREEVRSGLREAAGAGPGDDEALGKAPPETGDDELRVTGSLCKVVLGLLSSAAAAAFLPAAALVSGADERWAFAAAVAGLC